jgi:hypothetical protein
MLCLFSQRCVWAFVWMLTKIMSFMCVMEPGPPGWGLSKGPTALSRNKRVLRNLMMSLGWGELSRKLRPTPGYDAKEEEDVCHGCTRERVFEWKTGMKYDLMSSLLFSFNNTIWRLNVVFSIPFSVYHVSALVVWFKTTSGIMCMENWGRKLVKNILTYIYSIVISVSHMNFQRTYASCVHYDLYSSSGNRL